MPLFVPVLRLLMLFLNVYDSYKTLKEPPPSSRNAGRPSVRAISQRKRDIKGCLAVWIVWASLSIYERSLETIVCLFIPFYDEFKSLALLFLILTRARGAEPIYLHVIRPLVKPYTRTLDATLEIMLYTGDFIFALSTYPVRLGLDWYGRRFGSSNDAFDSESDTQSSSSNCLNTSELPTSFLVSSGVAQAPVVTGNEDNAPIQFPRKASNDNSSIQPPDRRPSADTSTFRHVSPKAKHNISDNPDIEPIFFNDDRRAKESSQHSSSQKAGHSAGKEASSNTNGKSQKPAARRQESGSSSRHQIWYPPKSSYVDEPDSESLLQEHTDQAVLLALEQQQYEEWRQYPPFPSAYPPTPLATTSRLATTSTLVSLQPAIEEDKVQEDFHKSLLPPREPLNPSHAGDLSDKYKLLGISPSPDVDDANDSMSADDYEDEDEFNITLRTPLPPRGTLRSQIPQRRFISLASASDAVSVPSRSSALTTADNGSAMQIDSSSLSDSSSSLSAPKPNIALPSTSVIGKKRSHPRSKKTTVRNRVRQIESETSQGISESDQDAQQVEGTLKVEEGAKASSPSSVPYSGNNDDAATSSSTNSATKDQEEIPPEEKRRKIIRSSQTPKAPRIVNPSRPIRPRVARYASPPAQSQKAKLRNLTGVSNTRKPTRLRSGTSTRKVKENEDPSSLSASSSASQPPSVPLKSGKRDLTRKRT